LAGNPRLDKRVRRLLGRARMQARTSGETATLYGETRYAARRWDRKRRIIMKAEVLCYPGRSPKDNPRFLVTNLRHRPATVYTRLYCGRGGEGQRPSRDSGWIAPREGPMQIRFAAALLATAGCRSP
jgi:DDE family transposase